jgi:16S rRNA (adenine1518-N6/adenine1519-N6)-dimethyltransferase
MSDLPKKQLGQHWLKDQTILNAISDQADLSSKDTVLEIGPGQGTLTKVLLRKSGKVVAVEYDTDLLPSLNILAKKEPGLRVVQADIRSFDLGSLPENYKIVANIPYYLTSNLIRKLIDTNHKPDLAVILMQKEVAERIASKKSKMSLISVLASVYYDINLGVEVPAHFFDPPPKVDSQVLVLKLFPKPLYDVDIKKFTRLIKSGFVNKRKNMRNCIGAAYGVEKHIAEKYLNQSGIDPSSRAEDLQMSDWKRLYDSLDLLTN